jgi:diacylglycerol kinase family enzyme
MCVAPTARLDDAELDLVIIAGLSKPRLLTKLAKLYTGAHLNDAAVALHRGRRIEIEAARIPVRIEVDGEPLGVTPAQIEILPAAITLIGPGAPRTLPVGP